MDQPSLFDPGPYYPRLRLSARRTAAGPARLPGRAAFVVPEDGRLLVDMTTGEIIERPVSPRRAARVAPRAAAHQVRLDVERDAAAERCQRWAKKVRAALPSRVRPGLERPAGGAW